MARSIADRIPEDTKDAQRRAADPATSSWASANAGAGKTHVLTVRVARLLLAGTDPSKILCLTYTKAAAAEMTTRLFDMLGLWSTMDDGKLGETLRAIGGADKTTPDLSRARQLFARALETPGGLKIQTIHSFCQTVLGRFPLEAGLTPGFTVLDDRQDKELRQTARDAMLAEADTLRHPALATALNQVARLSDESAFDQLLRSVLSHRLSLGPFLGDADQFDRLRTELWRRLEVTPGTDETALLRDALSDDALDIIGLTMAARSLLTGSKADTDRGAKLIGLLEAPDRLAAYDTYRSAFLTKDGTPSKRALMTKALAKANPAGLATLEAEQERIQALEQARRATRMARASENLLIIARSFLTHYQAHKRQRNALDYDDLIDRMLTLLRQDMASAWVLYKLDQGIDHILIDEAQDTSPEQWDIVRRLAAEFFAGDSAATAQDRLRTIFAVGDEKQSIYSFQGAEPAAFARMRDHFGDSAGTAHMAWDPVHLTLSFRSTPDILNAVDLVCASAGTARMVTLSGDAVSHAALRHDERGFVELWPPARPDEAPDATPWHAPLDMTSLTSPPARLAQRIADRIASWIREGTVLPSTGRAIRPSDILILVRRRNDFVEMLVRELKERRVPVAGADRLLLTDHIAVMDLIALGRAALLPDDDLTLATVLKSPFLGWSEDALFDLAHERTGTLWAALEARADEQAAWRATLDWLQAVRDKARDRVPFDFYAWLLGEAGGRRKLLARLGQDAADPIDELLALAQAMEQTVEPSLEAFLHALERDPPVIKRDMETGGDEVRIMTVHGAKGLEARIVFLPDTCTMPDGKQDPKVLKGAPEREDASPVLLWPGAKSEDVPASSTLRDQYAEQREAEYRRLLYVAMTRAKDRLYVCGYESQKGRPDGCWYDLIETALKPHAEEIELPFGETGWRFGLDETSEAAAQGEHTPQAKAPDPPAWVTQPAKPEPRPLRSLAPSQFTGASLDTPDTTPALSPAQRSQAGRFRRGRLIHKLLQILPDLPPAERAESAARFLAQPAHGLGPGDGEALTAEVLAVLDDPAFAALFGPGSQAEVPVAGRVAALGDDIVIDGQIDRLVVTPEAVHIVDFKTNRPAPTEADQIPAPYVTQMALYQALLAPLFPARPVRCSLLWTDGPHAVDIPQQAMDRALAKFANGAAP